MSVTIVHEWLTNLAGSEKVVAAMRTAFPGAPVATSVWWPEAFEGWDVRPSALQRLVRSPNDHIRLLPLLPLAFASLRVPEAGTVVTSFHTFALYARVPRDARHVVYCHTPPRFLWHAEQLEGERLPLPAPLADAASAVLRPLDRSRARRPDRFVANSRTTAERIRSAYGRDAVVVHPPVDVERFRRATTMAQGDHYLLVSRLVPYKRVDLAIAAFSELGLPLVVAGRGREEASLRRLAGPNVRFAGHVSDEELPALMGSARALVFPGEEDFGITPVEAMAAGTPVVAFRRGGATETVEEGRSGWFFDEQRPDSLLDAVRRADATDWDRADISASAERFTEARFVAAMRDAVAA